MLNALNALNALNQNDHASEQHVEYTGYHTVIKQ
jgi:hypothetical protein